MKPDRGQKILIGSKKNFWVCGSYPLFNPDRDPTWYYGGSYFSIKKGGDQREEIIKNLEKRLHYGYTSFKRYD
jgi:hypothetical protein